MSEWLQGYLWAWGHALAAVGLFWLLMLGVGAVGVYLDRAGRRWHRME